jgi:hypothetical protein
VWTPVDVDEDVFAPEPVDDLAARDEQASAPDQQDQQIHRLALESNRTPPSAAQLVGRDVELELAETKRLLWVGRQHGSGL